MPDHREAKAEANEGQGDHGHRLMADDAYPPPPRSGVGRARVPRVAVVGPLDEPNETEAAHKAGDERATRWYLDHEVATHLPGRRAPPFPDYYELLGRGHDPVLLEPVEQLEEAGERRSVGGESGGPAAGVRARTSPRCRR